MRWTRVITRCQIRRGEARRAGWKSLLSALRFACFRAAASVTRDRYPGGNRRTPRRWCLLHDSLFARSRHVKHLSAPLLFAQSSKPFGRRWLNRFLLLVSFNFFSIFSDFFSFSFEGVERDEEEDDRLRCVVSRDSLVKKISFFPHFPALSIRADVWILK